MISVPRQFLAALLTLGLILPLSGEATPTATGNVTDTHGYDAIGQVLTTTDPRNNVTTYAYDDAGRRTSVMDALTHATAFAYDAAGNQTSATDANTHTTLYEYDAANRRTKVTYPDSNFETTGYDALGRVTARTDANGKTVQYGYDALGRLTSVTDALNQITSYTYDEVGNRLTQTDSNNHTTNYAYDQRGRRTKRTLPLGQNETYTYDAAGNLLTRTDFNGKITTYTYDPANRLLSKTPDASFNAPAITYSYTNGRRASMTDVTGTTVYSYDSDGRPTQVWGAEGQIVYTYDAAGNLTRMTGPNSIPVNYTYDALNRLHTVQEANTGTTTYGYDNTGNLQTVTYPNGVVHGYTYDNRNRLTNLGVNNSTTAVATFAYTLDAAGHRTGVTELSGRTVAYGYDDLYRLTNETISGDPNNVNGTASYVYDPVGNRTQKTSTIPGFPGGLLNYDANDRLTTDTYDSNTTASNGVGYVYDFENHVIQAGSGITMVYDGDGNRVKKTVAGVTTTYLVDTQNPTGYAQVVSETWSGGSGSNRELSHTFVYGLERISQYRQYLLNNQSQTQTSYYVYDGHGSTRALTDPNGAVTDTYDYDAFGNLIHQTGTTANNYLFAGEQFDPDLNLYYNRARYLNTSTGRFWNMDVYEGYGEDPLSLHKYLYAEADPVDSTDPTGRSLSNLVYGQIVHDEIGLDFVKGDPKTRFSDTAISTILGVPVPLGLLRPDLTDVATQQVYEIKPTASAALGYPQLAGYLIVLNKYDPLKRIWVPGVTYLPPPVIQLGGGVIALVSPPAGGVIVYEVLNPVEILGLAAIAIKSMVPQLETDFAAATLEEVY